MTDKNLPIIHNGKNVGTASCVEITMNGATGRLELDPVFVESWIDWKFQVGSTLTGPDYQKETIHLKEDYMYFPRKSITSIEDMGGHWTEGVYAGTGSLTMDGKDPIDASSRVLVNLMRPILKKSDIFPDSEQAPEWLADVFQADIRVSEKVEKGKPIVIRDPKDLDCISGKFEARGKADNVIIFAHPEDVT